MRLAQLQRGFCRALTTSPQAMAKPQQGKGKGGGGGGDKKKEEEGEWEQARGRGEGIVRAAPPAGCRAARHIAAQHQEYFPAIALHSSFHCTG
jgi:hypothetical protein